MDGRTDRPSYRDARTHLKMEISKKKDLLTKEIEMRFVIIAFPGYPGVCLMIARVFVHIDLQNDDFVSPRMSDP